MRLGGTTGPRFGALVLRCYGPQFWERLLVFRTVGPLLGSNDVLQRGGADGKTRPVHDGGAFNQVLVAQPPAVCPGHVDQAVQVMGQPLGTVGIGAHAADHEVLDAPAVQAVEQLSGL